ncbi:hypothetical protein OIU76_016712 [Salix suchowensis]|nr:hypothetical protein OIU76_016712 [Salix suchowensis]
MEVDGCLPNSCTYNVIIQGFLRNGDTSNAVQLIKEMVGRGFSADSSTFQMLLDLESGDEIISRFMRGSSQAKSTPGYAGADLFDMVGKAGDISVMKIAYQRVINPKSADFEHMQRLWKLLGVHDHD